MKYPEYLEGIVLIFLNNLPAYEFRLTEDEDYDY